MKKIVAIILLILGAYMIYLSMPEGGNIMRPPMVSGIAFILIGIVWVSPRTKEIESLITHYDLYRMS
ncbi:MAG: hypothetical protein NXI09_12920 [Bacteroidetes bacterium]|nr:hypothetical protein [Bacteroidota bacterium]